MTSIDTGLQQRFEECVESCAESIYRVAYRLTSDHALANELVQETYLNAWRSLPSLHDPSRLRSWMFAILRNQYSKLMRRESKAISTTDDLEVAAEQRQENPAAERIQAAVSELDELHKLPVLLVAMEGMTVDEAAAALEIPRGTVLSRLHRGRKKLKDILMRNQEGYSTTQNK